MSQRRRGKQLKRSRRREQWLGRAAEVVASRLGEVDAYVWFCNDPSCLGGPSAHR